MKKSNKSWLSIGAFIALLLLICLMFTLSTPEEIAYSGKDGLLEKVANGEVKKLFVSGDYIVYVLYEGSEIKDSKFPKQYDVRIYIPNRDVSELYDAMESVPEGKTVPAVTYNNPAKYSMLISLVFPLLLVVVMAVVFIFIYRQNQGSNSQALNFGKTKARVTQNVKTRFGDVAGAEEEKEELSEVVEFLKNPKKFLEIGARIPKGVLLVGPPGTGKTLFAKAVAGEANVPFFSISGSDFVEMFVGVGASRVRDLFEQAKKNMPCIIFIDEIDAVGRQRGAGMGGGHDEREQTLNQLLVQMDGFETNEGIIIMAATNRADILDPALLRPGRFDRQIYVNIPDVKGREAIFKVHSRNKPLASDINFKNLARLTSGFTGADIENLLNEAAILAARFDRKVIIMSDIHEAINKVIAGPQKKSRVVTETDKRITAYHESGHAIVAKTLPHCDDVHEVSIIPRGMAAGYTITLPDNDDSHVTRNALIDTIAMMLAGRAAEEIVLKDISTGASNDIQRASGIARKMVTEWGMSPLGNIFLGSDHEVFLGRDFGTSHSFSEGMAGKVDEQVKLILDEAYATALKILKEKRSLLDGMVKVLYAKQTIFAEEVDMLFEGKTVEDVLEYCAKKEEEVKKLEQQRPSPVAGIIVPEPQTALDKVAAELKQRAAAPAEPSDDTAAEEVPATEAPAEETSKDEDKPNED